MAGTFNPGGLNAPPKSIINAYSTTGVTPVTIGSSANVFPAGIKMTLSGELTADTYKEIISISGPGVLSVAFVANQNTTSRTLGLKIVIDGVTVFESISAATTAGPDVGIIAVGSFTNTAGISRSDTPPVPFNSSLSVQIRSSISETDKLYLGCNYRIT